MLTTGTAWFASHRCWLITRLANLSVNVNPLRAGFFHLLRIIIQNQGRVASSNISPKLYIIYSEEKNLQVSCFFEWRSTHFSLIVSCHFFTNVVYAYTHVIYAKDCIVKRAQTSKTVSRAGLCRAVGQLILTILSLIANQAKVYLFYPISVRTTRAVILDFRTYHESFIFTFSLLCKVFLVHPRWGPKLIKNAQYKTRKTVKKHIKWIII